MEENKIKAIDKGSVHRICSGQVVLTLAIAVKELVENSIDAGASKVDVRLKDYGYSSVEVTDNGSGVLPENFQALTLKHHTSKLSDFSDLESVGTFGFRGEALSSLCALSNVTVLTRHTSYDVGTLLKFNNLGHIESSVPASRQAGTTVTLNSLFHTLPVRRKEFSKNIKREFNKMTHLLSAYCLVSTGVKISCINQTEKGTRTTFLNTQGCETVKENISCVYGSKQVSSLLNLKLVSPREQHLAEFGISSFGDSDISNHFRLEGYLSSCSHGAGRSTTDRQFYFINSRPCEPSKVMKLVNEVYHHYNSHQYPFVCLNIKMERSSVDVNVTPDKRQIFIDEEKLLLATIKSSLHALYENVPATYVRNDVIPSQLFLSEAHSTLEKKCSPSSSSKTLSFAQFRHHKDSSSASVSNKRQLVSPETKCKSGSEHKNKQIKLETHYGFSRLKVKESSEDCLKCVTIDDAAGEVVDKNIESPVVIFMSETGSGDNHFDIQPKKSTMFPDNVGYSADNSLSEDPDDVESKCVQDSSKISALSNILAEHRKSSFMSNTYKSNETTTTNEVKIDSSISSCNLNRKMISLNLSVELIEKNLKSKYDLTQKKFIKEKEIRFLTSIDPLKSSEAESELNKAITKDMFKKMEIVGQFNLGFIITRLDDDLFIIDQHATDEKYNFETLQLTTTLSNQKLVIPQSLDLTPANECVLLENMDIFKRNGFDFTIDESAVTGQRVKLSAIPTSQNWIFGKEDVDELLFMLEDSPGEISCRPSRVRAMFASRACRKSVMIGDHLSMRDMRRLVDNMAAIDQPWNCPHGRPTMRHLVNLALLNCNS